MTMNVMSRKKVFIGSMMLLVLAVVYRMMNPFTQETISQLTFDGTKPGRSNAIQGNAIVNVEKREPVMTDGRLSNLTSEQQKRLKRFRLDMALLHLPTRQYNTVDGGRDLFHRRIDSPPTEIVDIPDEDENQHKESKEREADRRAKNAAEMAKKERDARLASIVSELSSLRILGACKKDETLSFFIKDGDVVQVVTAGDQIKERYPITQLTQSFILIHIPEFNEDVKINLKDFNEDKYL